MGIQTRMITEDNINQIENMSYSNNYKVNARDFEDENFKMNDIKQLLSKYGLIDRQNSTTRQNIRIEKEDDIYFETVDDYDLHEFDEPEEKTPESPGYSPVTPDYEPGTPLYEPGSSAPDSPGYSNVPSTYEVDFTPKNVDEEFEKFRKEYINKYPDSFYGQHLVAYDKYKEDGSLIKPDDIPEEQIKEGPSGDDLERFGKNQGKIKLNIGSENDNFEKVSEKNLTFEKESILQPDKIE